MHDKKTPSDNISIVIPSYNEGKSLISTLTEFQTVLSKMKTEYEILVINDGSTDNTLAILASEEAQILIEKLNVKIITNPINTGYGFSLKRGIKNSSFSNICICDADGTYPIAQLDNLFKYYLNNDLDMVVAARTGPYLNSGYLKAIARVFFIFIAEFTTGRKIPDVNSGFRIFRKKHALKYLDVFSTGFSFTTSITVLFFMKNLFVDYIYLPYYKRHGKTKIKHFRDSLRALQIISHCILVTNPLKFFFITMIIYLFLIIGGSWLWMFSNILYLAYVIFLSTIFLIFSLANIAVQVSLFDKLKNSPDSN